MKTINKIIIFILVCSVAFSNMVVLASDEQDNIAIQQDNIAAQLFVHMGFISPDIDLAETVSRSEFSGYLVKINGYDTIVSDSAIEVFSDVNEETNNANQIGVLYDMGCISNNNVFRPDDTILASEAIKMIVCSLGYDYIAKQKGGYPFGYVATAQQIGLWNGKDDANVELTKEKMIDLLYDLMHVTLDITSAVDGIHNSGDPYFMEKRLDISKTQGIVTYNGITGLSGKSNVKSGFVEIDGVRYENPNKLDLITGTQVTAYYSYDSVTKERAIIYAFLDKSADVLSVDAKDIVSYSQRKYTYYVGDSDRQYTAEISTNCDLIYNEMAVTDGTLFTDDLMKPERGNITLIDNDDDGLYDVLSVECYRTVIACDADTVEKKVFDLYGNAFVSLEETEDRIVIITDTEGNIYQPDDILNNCNDDVMSVYESVCGLYVKVILGNKTVSGSIDGIKNDGETYYKIADTYYRFTPELEKELENTYISTGYTGTFYLDAKGDIARISEADSDSTKTGYVIAAGQDGNVLDKKVILQIFSDDKIYVYDVASNVQIDGVAVKDVDRAYSLLTMDRDEKRLIKFKLNAEEQIRWIDTIEGDNSTDPASIHWIEVASTSEFSCDYKKNYFYTSDTMIPIRADAPIILVSEPYVEGEILKIKFSELYNKGALTGNDVFCYNYDEDDFIADIAVVKLPHIGSLVTSLRESSTLNQMAVVTEKATVLDADLCEATELTLERGTLKNTAYGDRYDFEFGEYGQYDTSGANNYSVDVGDIIVYGTNSKGEIHSDNMFVIYDCDRDVFATPFSSAMTSKQNFRHVSVYEKSDEFIAFANYNDDLSGIQDVSELFILDMSKATIMRFDKDTQMLSNVSIRDVVSYEDAATRCSKGVLFTSYLDASTTYFIIYE